MTASIIPEKVVEQLRGQAAILPRWRPPTGDEGDGGSDSSDGRFEVLVLAAWPPASSGTRLPPDDVAVWEAQPGGVEVAIRCVVFAGLGFKTTLWCGGWGRAVGPPSGSSTLFTTTPNSNSPMFDDEEGGDLHDEDDDEAGLAEQHHTNALVAIKSGLQRASGVASSTPASAPSWRAVLLLLSLLAHQPVTTELLLSTQIGREVQALLRRQGSAVPQHVRCRARALLQRWRGVVADEWREMAGGAAAAGLK